MNLTSDRTKNLPTVEEHCGLIKTAYMDPVFSYLRGGERMASTPGQYLNLYSPVQKLCDLNDTTAEQVFQYYQKIL
jgi:hypothetical protein